jgi:hypothetical protein
VVGGDVIPGPMPRETLARLLSLDIPVQFIHGNGELAVLAQIGVNDLNAVTYWGTTSGNPCRNRFETSWAGRRSRFILITIPRFGAGPKPSTLRLAAWAECSFVGRHCFMLGGFGGQCFY